MSNDRPVAIVTGSSRGVGAACVNQLAQRGWNLVVNYSRSAEQAEQVAQQCTVAGAEVLLQQADVTRDADCVQLVADTVARFGRIDALVNNAGTTKFVNHHELGGLDAEDFQHIYATNVIGAFQMTRAARPYLQKAAAASVVMMASIAGIKGIGSSIAYAASKGAMITMTRSLARVLGPEIRVNAICPGAIQGQWLRDGLGEQAYDKAMSSLSQALPLARVATAEDVAHAIIACIESMPMTTGETLLLDGGHHLLG